MTILVIDDNKTLSFLVVLMLREEGYKILSTSDGYEGIKWVKEGQVDLVITDLEMPQLSGLEITKNIRQFNPDIPIILITAAFITDQTRLEMGENGINYYLYKPFEGKELKKMIAEILGGRRQEVAE